jgi:hypothetical protein
LDFYFTATIPTEDEFEVTAVTTTTV